MITRALACLMLLLALASLAGCATSEIPITAATHQAPDSRLIGQWLAIEAVSADGKPDRLKIFLTPDGRMGVTDGAGAGTPESKDTLEVITAEISGGHYASIGATDAGDHSPNYLLARYELVSADRLQLYIAGIERLEDAMRRGWIEGQNQPDRHYETIALKADAARLRKFIAAHGREIFADAGPVFERVAPTSTPTSAATPRRR